MWGMLDVTQAKLPVCPNSGIVSRRFTANGGKTGVDSINFSFARLGQKVIDASFSTTLSIFLYSTINNEIRYVGQGDMHRYQIYYYTLSFIIL